MLVNQNRTLAVAESCTGGLLSKLITDAPGASTYFLEGLVTYHDQSKVRRLKVKPETLSKFGAVSPQVARQMSLGLKKLTHADYTLSVTGIAGPTGSTPSKPIGLVYIACSTPKRTIVRRFHFLGDRPWIRHRAALMALDLLRKELRR
jgi:nicotinamide-nucleotide amidase